MLAVVSKIFERMIQSQIASFIIEKLCTYMSGYRNNTQYVLISLLEKCNKSLDNQGYAGAVIMDLPKSFDSINYELLIAKLHAVMALLNRH